jgi:integrase/recombinase XerD
MLAMSLSALIQRFFTDRLYNQLEASPHTIASYRDTFRLLLTFAGEQTSKSPTALQIDDLNAELIGVFLEQIETVRKNSVRSRNTRLAAIRSFFRFVALQEPAYLHHCQRILSMPSKRYVRRGVEFLNGSTWVGRRDHALLTLALQTGLRVSELVRLQCRDVVLETGAHVRCEGKGRKQRATPLRRETVTVLAKWLKERRGKDEDALFPTLRGDGMSRDALEHLKVVLLWLVNGLVRMCYAIVPPWTYFIMASTRR